MTRLTIASLLLGWLLCACGGSAPEQDNALPRLNALPEFSVSGISAGAYFAGQMHVAYAQEVSAAGLVAGGPWGCAGASIQQALGPCMTGDGLDIASLQQAAVALARDQQIDDLSTLADDKVFIFHGTRDVVVGAPVATAAADWYRAVSPEVSLRIVEDVPAVHGWPTVSNGAACGEFVEPWINACDYDLAGEMLAHLLGPLNDPVDARAELLRFSQEPYQATSMADEGLLFVPPACRDGKRCRVHVFLHGCKQAENQIGAVLAEQSGLLRWAAGNDLIVLFPQAASSKIAPMNPLACWDWWGYSGANYLQKDAAQMTAIRAMVARLQASD